MKQILILLFITSILLAPPAFASKNHTPLRYSNHERNLKHAGAVKKASNTTNIMILNYKTNTGANYKTNALCNYNTSSGLNYRPATNLRYR